MDCAARVANVTKAVLRLPGVSAVKVNLVAERLTLRPDADMGQPGAVEAQVATLGYTARRLDGHAAGPPAAGRARDHDHPQDKGQPDGPGCRAAPPHSHAHHDDPADATKPWWRTGRATLVWILGALVLGAYALSLALPERLTYPLFLVATAVALVPFGRRALALARAGSPFSIETLMVTAATGATLIGAAEEAAIDVRLFAVGELLENVAAGCAWHCACAPTAPPNRLRPSVWRSATSCWSAPATGFPAAA